MDQRRVLVLAGILGILILAIIIGTIVYLTHSFESSNPDSSHVVTSNPSSIPAYSPRPSAPGSSTNPNYKTYTGTGFKIQYPASWGLLTCANSKNFEFDPVNNTDQLNISCDRAVKPITVLVGSGNCQGQTVKLESISVVKSVDKSAGETDYRWCTQTTPSLDITHRTSPSGGTAISVTDYSSSVEDMISKINFASGS